MKELQKRILSILELLYGPSLDKYFLVPNKTETDVREEILNKFREDGIDTSYMDLYVVTSQIKGDVFIKV